MRETKGYDKSFIDGTIREHIKMKPDVEIKGVVTIQLFDEAGKLEREIKTENRITDAIARMAFMDYFCCRIRGNPWGRQWEYNDSEVGSSATTKDAGYKEGTPDNGGYYHQYSYFTAPFRYLLLTDDTTPESGFARAVKGNVIGWADKSRVYAGASTIKGTLNLSETLFTENNLHFVFDFATSVANGTFQKLWWADLELDSTQEIIRWMRGLTRNYKLDGYLSKTRNTPAPTNFTPGDYRYQTYPDRYCYPRLFKYNNKLYTISANKDTAKTCMSIINIDTEEYSEVDLYTTMGLTSTSYRPMFHLMAHENNYVYMIYDQYNKLHRLNLDDNTKTEVNITNNYYTLIGQQIPEIPSNWYSNIPSYLYNGMIGCKNGKLYIPLRYSNGGTNKTFILVCNPDANLTKVALYDLSTASVPSGSSATLNNCDLRLQPRDADTWFVCTGSYTYITDNQFNIIDLSFRNYTFDYNYYLEDTAGTAIKRYYINKNYFTNGYAVSGWGWYWIMWEPVAAMTLLPSPVTKTPTNTMKIQYDFNIQRVDPFQP